MLLKQSYFFILLLVVVCEVSAQQPGSQPQGRRGSRVIDDTTKQIYGPTTSNYFFESDVFFNRKKVYPIDTVIRNFHRYNWTQRYNNLYQDLGTIGTAARPIYFSSPEVIGVRSGFDVYDVYWDSERIRYFDTKSPYTNMNVILGGKGRSITKAKYSRNINDHWNVGFTYRGLFIDKQVPERTGKGDRVARGHYYDFFTNFRTKDSTYWIFANFQRTFHQVSESGGVRLSPPDTTYAFYFEEDDIDVWLGAAESNELRINVHVHHEFRVGKALHIYHTLDRYREKHKFLDILRTDRDFFGGRINEDFVVNDSVRDPSKFKVVRNEFGLKGNLSKLFYNGYYAIRHFNMTYYHNWLQSTLITPAHGQEHYLGGRMELRLDSIGVVSGWAEANQDGNYAIEGRIGSRWFDAAVAQKLYKPSFAEQAYLGTADTWNHQYRNIESSELRGNLHYRSRVVSLSPGVSFTRLKNYVFFDDVGYPGVPLVDTLTESNVQPIQSAGNQIYFSPQFRGSLTLFRHIILSNQTILTKMIENADNAIRLPELFVNAQLSYANIFFNGNLDMHGGVDVHWRSSFYAPGYDPIIRQFYNQDTFEVEAFPVVDLFFNAKVKRGRIFIKWNNVVQFANRNNVGYIATPFYPGQRTIVDFGFDWSFYD